MGKIGKCCCAEGECCICDVAWNYDNWSVTILGKTFSGTFSPADKPTPFTVANGCSSRQGGACIIDNPTTLVDCVQSGDWGATSWVGMDSATGECYEACPQCFCNGLDGMQDDEACLREDLINWETQSRGVTHSRAWQQEGFYGVAQMLCCDSPANSVKFVFALYYHVARFAAISSQGFRRFRSVTYDCIYAPGETSPPASNVVRGSWIEPVSVGSKPPCIPCDWDQSDFFGNCDTLSSPCSPCPEGGCPDEVVSYTMDWVAIYCSFIGFVDEDEDLICPIPDSADDFTFVFYGSSTMNAYVGTQTNYCGNATNSFGDGCIISPTSAVIEHVFISDCIPCDELGCSVVLNRVTGESLGEEIIECVFDSDTCECGTISELCKTIPASITLNLTPC